MIAADAFCAALGERGWTAFTGVPSAHLAGLVELMTAEPNRYGRYLPAADEATAVGYAAGAAAAGSRVGVLLPGAGLGVLVDPLAEPGLPLLLLVDRPGWPGPAEPSVPTALLDLVGVPSWTLDGDPLQLSDVLDEAAAALDGGRSAAVLVPPGTVVGGPPPAGPAGELTVADAAAAVHAAVPPPVAVVCAAEPACEPDGRPGSVHLPGGALAFGLGIAARRPDLPVLVLEQRVRLAGLATAAAARPENLVHVVLAGADPDLAPLALAAGYRDSAVATAAAEVTAAVRAALGRPGPQLLQVPVAPALLPVPQEPAEPAAARARFARWLSGHAS